MKLDEKFDKLLIFVFEFCFCLYLPIACLLGCFSKPALIVHLETEILTRCLTSANTKFIISGSRKLFRYNSERTVTAVRMLSC